MAKLIILTHMVQNVSCLPIFLPENQISLTIILNDLIFYKLDVILKTLFSMHNILIWSLKKKRFINFNCVLLTIKLAVGPWNLGIMTLGGCLNLSNSHKRQRQEKDKKCVLFTIFLVQRLTTSDNPISLWFFVNMEFKFWLEVENLKYYRK